MNNSITYLTDYGVSETFIATELYLTGLENRSTYSDQIVKNDDIMALIKERTQKDSFTLAGWIDQAVLELNTINKPLKQCLDQIDQYRPDQGGDIGLYQEINQKEILEIGISEEIGTLWVKLYKQS